jgi:hypothetical protein
MVQTRQELVSMAGLPPTASISLDIVSKDTAASEGCGPGCGGC